MSPAFTSPSRAISKRNLPGLSAMDFRRMAFTLTRNSATSSFICGTVENS